MDTTMQPSQGRFFLAYQGQYYPLDKPRILIGSDQSCDIRITDNPQVLPQHVQIFISQAGQIILQSMRGDAAVWVNGSAVSQQMLKQQDEIILSTQETRLKLIFAKAQETGSVPRQPANPALQSTLSPAIQQQQQVFQNVQTPGGYAYAAVSQSPAAQPALAALATETTRYMCAAGHLDEDFQDYVMRNVVYEERRALGESYGVDMPVVVSWCLAGLKRTMTRDAILTILLALCLGASFLAIVFVIIAASMGLSGLQSGFSSDGSTPTVSPLAVIGALLIGLIVVGAQLLGLFLLFNFEKWVKRRWPKFPVGLITYFAVLTILSPLSSLSSLLASTPLFFLVALLAVLSFLFNPGLIAIVLIWVTIFAESLIRYYGASLNLLRKDTFDPRKRPVALGARLEWKLQKNFTTGERNVIAYSGYRPFAGAGIYLSGWSLVVDTSLGAKERVNNSTGEKRQTPLAFTMNDLYTEVEKDVLGLGVTLALLEVEGKLYVQGKYLPESPNFFNEKELCPVTSVDPALVGKYKEQPTEGIRYYQCLRFNFWRGEMILTAFVRFVRSGKDLFVEVNYLLLPPMDPDYYWVDEKENTPRLSKIWELYMRTFDGPIQMWLKAPSRLLRNYNHSRRQQNLVSIARRSPAFDYGARTSLRQFASDDSYHLFFQELDQQMYFKMVNKQILDTLATFLNAHQIDTTNVSKRGDTIMNSATYNNMGGQQVVGNNNIMSGTNSNTTTASGDTKSKD